MFVSQQADMLHNTVLGDVEQHKSLLVKNYPTVTIYDPRTRQVIEEARPNDVPDQVIFNAVLSSGTVLTYKLHGSTEFSRDTQPRDARQNPRIPAIEWRIFGSQGQIRITSYDGMCNTWSLNYGQDLLEVEIYDARTDTLEQLPTVEDDFSHLPTPARNVARLYEAFAKARAGHQKSWYPDFEYGLRKHELIDVMYRENNM
jgi:predicted dehydrogenase